MEVTELFKIFFKCIVKIQFNFLLSVVRIFRAGIHIYNSTISSKRYVIKTLCYSALFLIIEKSKQSKVGLITEQLDKIISNTSFH